MIVDYLSHFGLERDPFSKDIGDAELWMPPSYCMYPSCRCDDVAVQFFDVTQQAGGHRPRLGHVKASVRSLRDPVIDGQPVLQQLWNALIEQVGVARLRDRFGRMRQVAARQPAHAPRTPARNAPCPCGSGKKFKRCCGK